MNATEFPGQVASTGDTGLRASRRQEKVAEHRFQGRHIELFRVPLTDGSVNWGIQVWTMAHDWTSWMEFSNEADARAYGNEVWRKSKAAAL